MTRVYLFIQKDRGTTFANIMDDAVRLEIPWQADLDGSGGVDVADLSEFCSQWLAAGTTANFNGNGLVDMEDFSVLAAEWQQ